jgi:hypothetical protein
MHTIATNIRKQRVLFNESAAATAIGQFGVGSRITASGLIVPEHFSATALGVSGRVIVLCTSKEQRADDKHKNLKEDKKKLESEPHGTLSICWR